MRDQAWWREPWTPLGALALLQWALVALLASRAEHNGWLYYQGGDETFLYSSSVVVETEDAFGGVITSESALALYGIG